MRKIRCRCRLFMHCRHAAHAGRHDGAAVIAIGAANDCLFLRLALKRPEMPHHPNDGVISFRSRIGIKYVIQTIGREIGKPFRKGNHRLIAGFEKIIVIGQHRHL